MNIFVLKDFIRVLRKHDTLPFDQDVYIKFKNAAVKPSEYWAEYALSITGELEKSQLKGFGKNYELTRGFGDAMGYPHFVKKRPMPTRIQKIFRIKPLFIPIEKWLTDFRQSRSRKNTFKNSSLRSDNQRFISHLAKIIAPVTSKLGVNRYFLVDGKDIPWGFMQTSVYFRLLKTIVQKHDKKKSLESLFDGNFMDIGGVRTFFGHSRYL